MKYIKYITLFLVPCIVFSACKKDSLMFFDSADYLYVNLTKDATLTYPQRSFSFTFDSAKVVEKTFLIPIKLAGRTNAQTREFKVGIVDSLTTAIPGTDFEIISGNQKIEAGKSEGFISVLLKRTAKMKTATFTIGLKINEDSNFRPGYQPIVKVLVSDRLIKPDWWTAIQDRLLGNYSELKCRLWLEFMGVTDGSNPWATGIYPKLVFNGLAYVTSLNEANAKTSILAFRDWLRTVKADPFDPDLNTTVSLSLGTF